MADTCYGNEAAAGGRLFNFDALQAEVMRLAEAARDYLAGARIAYGEADAGGDPAGHLAATCETTRLVTRLGFCLAWLLARRAVQSGELAAETAAGEGQWRLGGREVCLAGPVAGSGDAAALPRGLADLLDHSAELYRRIERLDRGLDG